MFVPGYYEIKRVNENSWIYFYTKNGKSCEIESYSLESLKRRVNEKNLPWNDNKVQREDLTLRHIKAKYVTINPNSYDYEDEEEYDDEDEYEEEEEDYFTCPVCGDIIESDIRWACPRCGDEDDGFYECAGCGSLITDDGEIWDCEWCGFEGKYGLR